MRATIILIYYGVNGPSHLSIANLVKFNCEKYDFYSSKFMWLTLVAKFVVTIAQKEKEMNIIFIDKI